MPGISRRVLTASAAASMLPLRKIMAQATSAEVTRTLPRTYSGATLRITWANTPSYLALAKFCEAFTTATGVALEFQPLLQADRYQKVLLDLTTKTNAYDVYLTAYQWKDEVAPHVADLTHIDQEVKGAPALEWDDYPKRALDAYARMGDKYIAVPIIGDASMLVWNKKVLRAAGLDPEMVPADWDAVYETGRKVTRDRQYGFNMPAGKSIQTACVWITLFHGFGGTYFDAAGRPNMGSDAGVRAIRFMMEKLGAVSPPGILTWDFPEMLNGLASGQSAQGYMWTGGFSTLFDPNKSAMAGEVGWSATPQAVLLGGWGLTINATSKSLDAAKLFVAWVTSREISRQTALISGTPCRVSAFNDPAVVAKFPLMPAVLKGMSGPVATYAPIKESEQVNIMIYDEVNAACAKTKTPEQAAGDLNEKVTAFMKRRGYLKL